MSARFAVVSALECGSPIPLDGAVWPSLRRFGNTWGTRSAASSQTAMPLGRPSGSESSHSVVPCRSCATAAIGTRRGPLRRRAPAPARPRSGRRGRRRFSGRGSDRPAPSSSAAPGRAPSGDTLTPTGIETPLASKKPHRVLVVEPCGGDPRIGEPGERDVVEDLIPREVGDRLPVDERVRDVLVAARVVVDHPCGHAGGRVGDPVERLRPQHPSGWRSRCPARTRRRRRRSTGAPRPRGRLAPARRSRARTGSRCPAGGCRACWSGCRAAPAAPRSPLGRR